MKRLIIFLFLPFYLLAQNSIDERIDKIAESYDAAGLAVVVVKNKKPVFEHYYGYKNLDTKEPIERDDIFRIASISKSFTATAIMQLLEQKKVHLDDDVSDLIGFKVRNPQYPDVKITLKMLLSHISSISDSKGYFSLDIINPATNDNYGESYNDYQPGTQFKYSNLGYNMIGTIIERVSGERFDRYIYNHILQPLGLHAGFDVNELDSDRFVTLYHSTDGGLEESIEAYDPQKEVLENYRMGYDAPIFSPTGGMKISAPDLAKYMTMHMNYGKLGKVRIMKKKTSKLMQTAVDLDEQYAMALRIKNDIIPGVTLTGHTGSKYGLLSTMFFQPKKKYGIVVITNGCIDCRGKLLNEVFREAYKEFID